mgnify:CR=1 FL=1
MDNTTLFDRLFAETCKIASLDATQFPVSRGCKKRWLDLLDIWAKNRAHFHDPFYVVLFHIQRMVYPHGSSATSNPYFWALLEDAILNDTHAFEAWKHTDVFRSAFLRVQSYGYDKVLASRNTHSNMILRFLEDRLWCKTYYRNATTVPSNWAMLSNRELWHLRVAVCTHHNYKCFHNTITLLIPSAATWSESQWLSEQHILQSFDRLHGTNYQVNTYDFDLLIQMVFKKLNNKPHYKELFLLHHIPLSAANLIWPQSMLRAIGKEFLYVVHYIRRPLRSRLAQKKPDRQEIMQSWAYQQLNHAYKTPNALTPTVCSELLLFSMGI